MRRTVVAFALLATAAVARPAHAQEYASMARWERFDWTRDTIDARELATLPLDDVKRLRALVFGRHGRVFDRDPALARYLASRDWYRPDSTFDNAALGATERANLERIRRAEAAMHPAIEPGDLQFWQDRAITQADLRLYTPEEWTVLKLEVEALHGRPLDVVEDGYSEDEPDTTATWRYFHERYWYQEDSSYSIARLSPRERANLDTLRLGEMRQHGDRVPLGTMELLQQVPLTDAMLARNTLYELRLLRNEVFARRGRKFTTSWIATYFADQSWYAPRAGWSDTVLTPMEKQNLATIRRVEERKHAELATTDIGGSDLEGLEAEDARLLRYEIYARRGIVFTDRKVQGYFASLPWYHPDPSYRDALLTERERKNVVAILEYEAMAKGGIKFYPPG